MNHDHTRDYATAAFRLYARWGGVENYVRNLIADLRRSPGIGICKPTEAELVKRDEIMRENQAAIADLEAVDKVIRICQLHYWDVWQAIDMVYFYKPYDELDRGDIVARVHYADHLLFCGHTLMACIRDALAAIRYG